MTQESIETFSAVSARKTVKPDWNVKDGKPLTIGALGHVGLKFFSSNMLIFAAYACSCKQITAFGNKTRSVASAQKNEKMQQKKWLYESFG